MAVFVGIASSVAPLYVTELSPIRVRGAIGSVPRVMATLAILVSEVVGLPELLGNETRWPFIFSKAFNRVCTKGNLI